MLFKLYCRIQLWILLEIGGAKILCLKNWCKDQGITILLQIKAKDFHGLAEEKIADKDGSYYSDEVGKKAADDGVARLADANGTEIDG